MYDASPGGPQQSFQGELRRLLQVQDRGVVGAVVCKRSRVIGLLVGGADVAVVLLLVEL